MVTPSGCPQRQNRFKLTLGFFGDETRVRFHHRWIKKRYKKGEYSYKHYFSSYPARLNREIEPHENKDFEIAEFKHDETDQREFIRVTYARDKQPETKAHVKKAPVANKPQNQPSTVRHEEM